MTRAGGGGGGEEDLDGDGAIDTGVLGAVDRADASRSELRLDLVRQETGTVLECRGSSGFFRTSLSRREKRTYS